MVQYYGLLEYKALPVKTQAALALGLPDDSRTKMNLAGQKVPTTTLLLASILDNLQIQTWMRSGKGKKPASVVQALLQGKEKKEAEVIAFRSGEDFERYRERLMRSI